MAFPLGVIPLLAAGQLATLSITINDQASASITAASCNSAITATWTFTTATRNFCGSNLELWATDGECADVRAATDLELGTVSSATFVTATPNSSTVSIDVAKLPFFVNSTADGGTGCGALGIEKTHKICGGITLGSGTFDPCSTKSVLRATSASLIYDTKAPAAPSLSSVDALDSSISVTVSAPSDAETVRVELKGPTDTDFYTAATISTASSNRADIEDLINGTDYQVRAVALDAAENASVPSAEQTVTPVASAGFYAEYRAAGGAAQGCAIAPGLLAVLALLMLNRRRT